MYATSRKAKVNRDEKVKSEPERTRANKSEHEFLFLSSKKASMFSLKILLVTEK
jgi:hypothetical protein